MAAYRATGADDLYHPTWLQWQAKLHQVDNTGHAIVALSYRPDARALVSLGGLLKASPCWCKTQDMLLLGAFLLQCYWLLPMVRLWGMVEPVRPTVLTGRRLKACWAALEEKFRHFEDQGRSFVYVLDGSTLSGLHPLKSPSERRTGKDRFLQLADDLQAWRKCCEELAALFDGAVTLNLIQAIETIQ